MQNKTKNDTIEFYKGFLNQFVIVNFTANNEERLAKGKLISISEEGKLLIVGSFRQWVIDYRCINNISSGVKNGN